MYAINEYIKKMGTAASSQPAYRQTRADLYCVGESSSNSYARSNPHRSVKPNHGYTDKYLKERASILRNNPQSNRLRPRERRSITNQDSVDSSWEHLKRKPNNVKEIQISLKGKECLGFSIRGGIDHGIGIYVSHVEEDSIACQCGLEPGDKILSLNGESFLRISKKDAAKHIRSNKILKLQVRHVGCIPGTFETNETYHWVDQLGCAVSPPPEIDCTNRYDTLSFNKSRYMLLKQTDERKVRLCVRRRENLGLMIRGGNEFGLGIYISGIDAESPAENAGLQVGDQILDANGHSFLDIMLKDAVRILTSLHHLILTVKDVGKVPHSRATYAMTDWIKADTLTLQSDSVSRSSTSKPHSLNKPHFVRGAGSQLMLKSMNGYETTLAIVNDKSRRLLTQQEQSILQSYLRSYLNQRFGIEVLTDVLHEVLDTPQKTALLEDIRGLIKPIDTETYENFIYDKTDHHSQSYADSGISQHDDFSDFTISRPPSHKQHQYNATRTITAEVYDSL